eukprot:CAMPEP_0113903290 /NCGR_PEP_ID=MMETSP0780_2-20120614/22429_1 /TAXON_ID=652834 /ORGANISM="Palpitomonas bilix" /LENGTH=251 /DNA_ID=CAMNT_0000896401 /DNA_START=35 /DNA_END=790 /DNA_ORIENTATION=+ /assembly_acc=CAM_ASM_000599
MAAAAVGRDQIWAELNSADLHPSLTGGDVKLYLHESGKSAIVVKRATNRHGIPTGDRASLFDIVRDERGGIRLEENEVVKIRLGSGSGCIQFDFAQPDSTLFRSFLIVPVIDDDEERQVYVYSSSLHSARDGEGGEGDTIEWKESRFSIDNVSIFSCCFSSPTRIVTTEFVNFACIYEKRGEKWAWTSQVTRGEDSNRYEEHKRLASLPLPPCQKEEVAKGGQLKFKLGVSDIALLTRLDEDGQKIKKQAR